MTRFPLNRPFAFTVCSPSADTASTNNTSITKPNDSTVVEPISTLSRVLRPLTYCVDFVGLLAGRFLACMVLVVLWVAGIRRARNLSGEAEFWGSGDGMLFCKVGLAFMVSIRAEFEGCGGDEKSFENLYGGVDSQLRL